MGLSIEDRLAVQDVMVRYAYARDLGTEEDLLAVFVEDPILESGVTGTRTGREALRAMARRDLENRKTFRLRHVISNFRVSGAEDRANVLAYFVEYITWVVPSRPHPSHGVEFIGHYDCDVRKIDGEWRIERRIVFADGRSAKPGP